MSQTLQRVVVRMLHDPAFADAVLAGQRVPELSPHDLALLRRTDPRQYRTDPYRRGRLVTALAEELPATAALVGNGGRSMPRLDAFLSSEAFHRCIQDRGSLAGAFAGWAEHQGAGDIARLEGTVAAARRDPLRQDGHEMLQRARGLLPVCLRLGTVARWQELRRRLGPAPLQALAEGRVRTKGLPREGAEEEWALVEVAFDQPGEPAGLSLEGEALCRLLLAASSPTPHAALVATAADLGAGEDAGDVIDGLVADGLLLWVAPA
ncbi:MAG: hypothetical protein H6742_13555 [Alphaproteobacteria bacterium]|nr:hypothetical protein [Alphaproteobacteria bacterium]